VFLVLTEAFAVGWNRSSCNLFGVVYLTVVPLAHIIWCSVFRISGEPCIARDICDVVGDTVFEVQVTVHREKFLQ